MRSVRSFRLLDVVYTAALVRARLEGVPLGSIVETYLEAWGRGRTAPAGSGATEGRSARESPLPTLEGSGLPTNFGNGEG